MQTDLDADTMDSTIKEYAQKMSDKSDKADMIVVVVLSHGDNGKVYGTDGSYIEEQDILRYFKDESLADIPKFFVFGWCR